MATASLLGLEHLGPAESRERAIRAGGARALDRVTHRLLEQRALGRFHQSSPSSRSLRAMMLRCTSAVPP
jgi:hypothetical protein